LKTNKFTTIVAAVLALTVMAIFVHSGEVQAANWSASAPMSIARSQHTATQLNSGRVLAVGGIISGGRTNSAELYNPAFGTWSTAASMTTTRSEHSATRLANGKVLVAGGTKGTGAGTKLNSVELYDPDTNTWSPAAPMSVIRTGHSAVLLNNGKVLVVGGRNSGGSLDSAELYDPVADSWSSPAGSMAAKRYLCSATLLNDGRVLVAGGEDYNNNTTPTDSAQIYDPATNSWSDVAPLPLARYRHTATLLNNGMVLMTGGRDDTDSFNTFVGFSIEYAAVYDPVNDIWNFGNIMSSQRAGHSATLLSDGTVLVAGGEDSSGNSLSSAELYDPLGNSWSDAGSMASARYNHSALLLPNNMVLVTGGTNNSSVSVSSADLYGNDATAPVVSAFTLPATATSLTVPVSSFTATDNAAVTGYLVTTSATKPAADAAGWTATAPANAIAAAPGSVTFYAWAKDAAGNVSAALTATVIITLSDNTAPVVNDFTLPATATSLTVSVNLFTATDNVGVTGYLITTSATPPAADAAGWTAGAPATVTAAAPGSVTFYAWAKDAAGNVSASKSAMVVITLSDNTAPVVNAFTLPATATSLTVLVSSFTATDNVAVTGYLITTSATKPAAGAAGWTAAAPANAVAAAPGSVTFYAWAKDAAGNVSASKSATVVITLPDTTAPVVNVFTLPATATSLTVLVSSFTATDNVSVTGYLVTTSATPPAANAAVWTAGAPATVTANAVGSVTFYAWAKDAAGNVSTPKSATVVITLPDTTPPVVNTFTLPASSNILTVSVSSFTATDNVAVTGYLVTTSATTPAAGAAGWTAGVPATVTANAVGSVTFYAWAKDAAGNISASKSATIVITMSDSTAPVVSDFTLPDTAAGLTLPVTVPVSSFTATDNVAVSGYLITTSATKPAAGAAGWTATAPATAIALTEGSVTFYAWAKDAAGNVSASKSATVVITLPDTKVPKVTGFTLPSSLSFSTTVATSITATDNVAVTGYLITTSATPPAAGAAGWTDSAQTNFIFTNIKEGVSTQKTLYAWAKDAAGNISLPKSATVTLLIDTKPPVVTSFKVTSPVTGPDIPVKITATDNVNVSRYMVTESEAAPASDDTGWSTTGTFNYKPIGSGDQTLTLYAWAKDSAGNVSVATKKSSATATVDATPPTVTFTVPGYSTSLKIPVSLSADDNGGSGVAGYKITQSVTPPEATDAGWLAKAPGTYAVKFGGLPYDLYGWAKDKAGNVSAVGTKNTVIVDVIKPVVNTFNVTYPTSGPTATIDKFDAKDEPGGSGIGGYLITESATKPLPGTPGWSPDPPTSYTFTTTGGAKKLYGWAKDLAGNVSVAKMVKGTIASTLLSGMVTSDGTTGVAGVTVSVYNAATGALAKSVKTSAKIYTVTGLATDTTYKVLFDGSALTHNYSRKLYNGDMIDFDNATPVITTSAPVSSIDAVLLSLGGSISGTVTSDGIKGIPGIRVSVYTTDGKAVFGATGTTDKSGKYTIKGLPAGDYNVQFDGGSLYVVGYNNARADLNNADAVHVNTGQITLVPVATLSANNISSVSGQVTDGSFVGIPNAKISVYTVDGSFVKSTVSNADGNYSVTGLTSGDKLYKLFFDGAAMGYSRKFLDGEIFDIANTTPVDAPSTDNNPSLEAAGSISGTVTDTTPVTPKPLAGIKVSPLTLGGNPIFGAGRLTDTDGKYTINGLPAVSYKIVFDGTPAWTINYYNNQDVLGSAEAVPVVADKTNTNTNVILTTPP
jgi:hypothetical protein